MINKILMHGYALIGLALFAAYTMDTMAYHKGMFQVAIAQANAIIVAFGKLAGT